MTEVENVRGKKKPHIIWIDYLRFFAISSVILVHVTENIYPTATQEFLQMNMAVEGLVVVFIAAGRLGVPIFLLISGYLLLDREYDAKACVKFWKKNLFGLWVTTEVWIVLYTIYLAVYKGETFDLLRLVENMCFVQSMQSRVAHIWYLFMILGIYLFLPLVANVLQKFRVQMFLFPMTVAFVMLFVVPILSLVCAWVGKDTIGNQLSLDFGGGIYGFIVLCGYFVKKGMLKRFRNWQLSVTAVVCFCAAVLLFGKAYRSANMWIFNNNGYNCAFILISAMCIFELTSRAECFYYARWVKNVAYCSFGMYFVHWPVREILTNHMAISSNLVKVLLIVVLTFVISWGIVSVIGRIPKLRKILFFMR